MTTIKRCHNCTAKGARKAAPLFTCRDCDRQVCEHFCGNKVGKLATCGSCKIKSSVLRVAARI
jgi:hypothetical protein